MLLQPKGLMAPVILSVGVGIGLLGGGSFHHYAVEHVSYRKTWQRMAMYVLNLCETKFAVNDTTIKLCRHGMSRSLFRRESNFTQGTERLVRVHSHDRLKLYPILYHSLTLHRLCLLSAPMPPTI